MEGPVREQVDDIDRGRVKDAAPEILALTRRGPDLEAEIDGLSYEQLLEAKEQNLRELASVDWKIQSAKVRHAAGEPRVDADPWRRMHAARKIMGLKDQAIANRLAMMNRRRKDEALFREAKPPKAKSFPQHFMDAAEHLLDSETFGSLCTEAKRREVDLKKEPD